jgi:hypothetical protein
MPVFFRISLKIPEFNGFFGTGSATKRYLFFIQSSLAEITIKGEKGDYFKIDSSERAGQSTGFASHTEEIISFYNTIFWPFQGLISTGIKARSILAFPANELEM